MSRTVWKYGLFDDQFGALPEYRLPKGARIVDVHDQDEKPHMWVEVDPEAQKESRYFVVVGTGHPIPDGYEHVGTSHSGPFVWHLYERATPSEPET